MLYKKNIKKLLRKERDKSMLIPEKIF